jgi:alpha-tubulin suppressor-like RCC1 family protein
MGDALPAIALPAGLRVRSVAAGGLHTCAIFSDDTLRCWGDNTHGQLGYGDTEARGDFAVSTPAYLPPIDLGAHEVAEQVVTSTASTCVLSRHALGSRRSVRCWGNNVHGELGYGDTAPRADTPRTRPALLAPLALGDATSEPLAVTLGWDHACAQLSDHTVQCWGDNDVGQLGLGDTQNRGASLPIEGMPRTDLGGAPSGVYAGISHSCATFDSGEVRCWGYNNAGQLGVEHLDAVGDQPREMGRLLRPTALR